MTRGQKLVAWRLAKGWTQRRAAEEAGTNQPTWHGLENGSIPRDGKLMERVEEMTDGAVTVSDFTESDEERALRMARREARTAKPDESGTDVDAAAKAAG